MGVIVSACADSNTPVDALTDKLMELFSELRPVRFHSCNSEVKVIKKQGQKDKTSLSKRTFDEFSQQSHDRAIDWLTNICKYTTKTLRRG